MDEMKISGIFSEYVCDYKFDDSSEYIEIPCPGIGLDEILKIIKFCKKYALNPYKIKKKPWNTTNIEDIIDNQWYIDFLCITENEFVDLYKAADYLHIDKLLDLMEIKVLLDTIKVFNDNEDIINIDSITKNMLNDKKNMFDTESLINLIANDDAVDVCDVGEDVNITIRHRICQDFNCLYLEAADATNGTSEGTAKYLKDSISKFDILRRIRSGISDQKTTENQGIIRAKEVVQSTDFKQAYYEIDDAKDDELDDQKDDDTMDDDEYKVFLNTYCGTHVVVGVSVAATDTLKLSYDNLQKLGIIKYESFAVYVIRDVLKFFTSKEDGIKHSLDDELEGYLLELSESVEYEKWKDPTKGMRKSFAGTREPYAYKLGARTWNLIDIILKFLGKVEYSVAGKFV